MNSKQRLLVVFAMLSLIILMLGFQNCSSGVGLNGFDSQDSDSIIDPPSVFAAKDSGCTQPYSDFKTSETIYICIQNAGNAPQFCIATAGSGVCNIASGVASAATGWGGMSGNWVKAYTFSAYSYAAYVTHTSDPSSIGQSSFNVTP
jgi:hypothetical protein